MSLTIYGKLIDENYSRMLIEKNDLPLSEVLLLDRVQKSLPIERADAKRLRQQGLIEGRYPRLYVSAEIAKATRTGAEYIKHRAFDKQYYKDLVLAYLKQHGEAGPSELQRLLMDKLTDMDNDKQRRGKVRNLMQEMSKKERSIQNIGGRGDQAKWVLVSPQKGEG
ncbi:MAG: hypothetical protein EOM26_12630 [Alphaproteobacteria bacterium]|nr:hypothetical protein [Alphaproteobacteria bacterium]